MNNKWCDTIITYLIDEDIVVGMNKYRFNNKMTLRFLNVICFILTYLMFDLIN
jgi:hypothetical protein